MSQSPLLQKSYTAIWQSPNPHEREWIEEIFGQLFSNQITDGKHELVLDNVFLFDAFVYCNDLKYYQQFRGKNAFLVHFLDENYEGLYEEIYSNFRGVFRCHWSSIFNQKYVSKMPLGYSNGMGRAGRPIPQATKRKYVWSFAGALMKSSRPDMAKALLPLKPHFFSPTDDVSSLSFLSEEQRITKRLTPSDFSGLLFQSTFSPCPMGNVNLECFRVYEALECGSIPIVEKRLTLDYFRDLLGDHPMPAVRSWPEARRFVEDMLRRPDEIDRLQERCIRWWVDFKKQYKEHVADFVRERAADPAPVHEPIVTKAYARPGWRTAELLRHHDLPAFRRRVQRQVSRLLRDGKLRVAHRPGAK